MGYYLTVRGEVETVEDEEVATLHMTAAAPLGYYGPVFQVDELSAGHNGVAVVRGAYSV